MCIFRLAPGYKGVFCYDQLQDKCFLSRHVIHDEHVFPFKKNHDHDNFKQGKSSTSGVLIASVVVPLPSSSIPQFNDAHSSQSFGSVIRTPSLNHVSASSFHQDSLPILTDKKFQVIIPFDSSCSSMSTDSIHVMPTNVHSLTTQAKDGIIKKKQFPDYQGYYTCLNVIDDIDKPTSYKIATTSFHWEKAMQEEINALHMQGTWVLVPNPGHKNIVCIKWIYKIKKNSNCSIARYKARLVAQGFSQEP